MKKHDNRYPIKLHGLSVEVRDGNFERSLKIFSKKVQESGLLKEVRDRMYYETGSEIKQRKRKMARKRWLKKQDSMSLKDKGTHGKKY